MTHWHLYNAALLLHVVLYLIVPIVLFLRGRPWIGGAVMLAATFIPLSTQLMFTDSEAPGFLFLLAFELLFSACITTAAVLHNRNKADDRGP